MSIDISVVTFGLPLLLRGLVNTVLFSFAAIAVALLVGPCIALARLSKRSLLRYPRTRRCAGKGLAAVLAPCYSGRLVRYVNRVPRLGTATNRELTDGAFDVEFDPRHLWAQIDIIICPCQRDPQTSRRFGLA